MEKTLAYQAWQLNQAIKKFKMEFVRALFPGSVRLLQKEAVELLNSKLSLSFHSTYANPTTKEQRDKNTGYFNAVKTYDTAYYRTLAQIQDGKNV